MFSIFNILKRIHSLIPVNSKQRLKKLVFFSTFSTFLEILGVALIIPLVYLISDKNLLISKIPFEFANNNNFPIIFFGFIILLFVLKNILLIWFLKINTNIIFTIGNEISNKVYRFYLFKKYEFFRGKDTSIFIRNVVQDVNIFVVNIILPIITLSIEFFLIFGSSVILFVTDPYFFILIFSIGSLVGVIYFKKFQTRLSLYGKDMLDTSAKRIKLFRQGFDGIKDIIINQTQNRFNNIFEDYSLKFFDAVKKKHVAATLPRFLIEIIFVFTFGIFISFMILRGDSLSQIFAIIGIYSAIAFRLMPSFIKIYTELSNLKFSLPVINELEKIFSEKTLGDEIEKIKKDKKLTFKEKIIFKNLKYKHSNTNKKIFDNLNLEINYGERIGVIGESGSGKTTFVDLLTGIIDPISGQITIDNNNLKNFKPEWFKIIGYMSQKFYIIDGTVKENIFFGNNECDKDELNKILEIVQLKEFIDSLENNLDTVVDENGNNFSGGQLQRIVLARTLVKKPEILILDECTSALDKDNEQKLLHNLINNNFVKTIIIISHRKESLNFCNKILKVVDGKIDIDEK